jgi:hypothetical protein
MIFSLRFTCLPASYVPVVVIHPLGGSRVNMHHMPNPQPSAIQPTQDGDSQATSNPLEFPFVISHREGINPSQITRRWPRTITNSCQHSSTAPSHLGIANTQSNKKPQQIDPQVPLDAITQTNALRITQSHFDLH